MFVGIVRRLLSCVVFHREWGFFGPKIEEARACISRMKTVLDHSFSSVVIEAPCASLIAKMKKKERLAKEVGLFVSDIIELCKLFQFSTFLLLDGGDMVAHTILHLRPEV